RLRAKWAPWITTTVAMSALARIFSTASLRAAIRLQAAETAFISQSVIVQAVGSPLPRVPFNTPERPRYNPSILSGDTAKRISSGLAGSGDIEGSGSTSEASG
ncbi:MAG: hypothetical protein KGJ01_02435, partial [Patescibacteria group bacterium]|nr:hypothetical protein [Patescibacteria group bacterium]